MKIYGLALLLLVVACQQDFNAQSGKTSNLSSQLIGGSGNAILPPGSSTVFVGNFQGNMYALDGATGSQKWMTKVGSGNPIISSPTVGFGQVYAAISDTLFSFNATTGSIVWTQGPPLADTISSPMIYKSVLLAGGHSTTNHPSAGLIAFQANTGSKLWSALAGLEVMSSPTVAEVGGQTLAVVGTSCSFNGNVGNLHAVNLSNGKVAWSVMLETQAINSSPAIVNGIVYVGTASNLQALDAATGQVIWAAYTGGSNFSSPTVDQGIVYIGGQNKLYAFDAGNGSLIWVSKTGNYINSSPIVFKGNVYIGSDKLYAFDALTGVEQWTATTNGYVDSSPTAANGIVYVGSKNAGINFYAFDYSTGSLIWSKALGNAYVVSSACVVTQQGTFHPGISGEQQ